MVLKECICESCDTIFYRQSYDIGKRTFCSVSCSSNAPKPERKKERVEYSCAQCKKLFYFLPSQRKSNNLFCSRECRYEYQKGKPPHNKGKQILASFKCKPCDTIVTKPVHAIRRYHGYCSRKCYGKSQRVENKNIRSPHRLEYKEWRMKVLHRDGGKCIPCSFERKINRNCLQVHHIIPYSINKSLEFNVDNGITLCKYHHDLTRIGEDTWAEYFASLINVELLDIPSANSHIIRRNCYAEETK